MQVRHHPVRITVAAAVLFLASVASGGTASAVGAPVGLGTAATYAVLAGTTVTNTGPTAVTGDLGLHPGAAVVGFPPGVVAGGAIHAADAPALQAKTDLVTAYDDAAARITTAPIAADLGGQTLVSGVYTGGAVGLTGTLTLDGQGDPSAVFVFQAASTLITAPASTVVFTNGAQACNVYWQVGSSATLGTGSSFSGTILALTAITAQTGATISGRLLARNAAVTLDDNTISRPVCAAVVPPVTTTSTSTTSTTSTTVASTTSTSTSATTPETSPTVPGAVAGSGGSGGGTGVIASAAPNGGPAAVGAPTGTLPRTGSGAGVIVVGGLVAVAAGALLLQLSRGDRRSSSLPLR